jgi:adenosylhomocysteine nucleosidase
MGDLTPSLGIVCGMVTEVRALGQWARDPRVLVAVSGARPGRAEAEARRLVAAGCQALLSWGVAGGLDSALVPGDLVVPAEVLAEDGACWGFSAKLRAGIPAGVPSPRRGEGQGGGGRILGLDHMVMTTAEKATLFQRTGAVAVDMESHRVARVAAESGAEAGLPALAIRAIGDPAGRAPPALAATALGEDGRPRIGPVAAGLMRRPGDLAALLRVKRDTDAALAALAGFAGKVIPAMLKDL